MDRTTWEQVKTTLASTLELTAAERPVFLKTLAPEIRSEVEELVAAYESADDFIARTAAEDYAPIFSREAAFPQIDGYNIIRQIGVGGMGTIYLAEYTGDGFTQNVALKVIKSGMDSAAVLDRFFLERRILATLDHTNIARMFSGGTTADGRPYFVMEYVDGVEIRQYVRANDLGINERLGIFQMVCDAVASAHQKLVVHRDIKPTNILVKDDGTPKLLDFGIAKLLSQDGDMFGESTAAELRILTPEYASPEQMAGHAASTTSDIYSLGVVLYELLAGKRPQAADHSYLNDGANDAKPKAMLKPSSLFSAMSRTFWPDSVSKRTDRLNTVTSDRRDLSSSPKTAMPQTLDRDLNNIVQKAMRREPELRYQTVQELMEDIRRYLSGLPVNATADSRRYRFGKFYRRHKTGVTAGMIAGSLIAGTVSVGGWQFAAANRERARAEDRLAKIRSVAQAALASTKNEDMLRSGELLNERIESFAALLDSFSAEESNDPELLSEIADIYDQLGHIKTWVLRQNTDAKTDIERAVHLREMVVKLRPNDEEPLKKLSATLSGLLEFEQLSGDQAEISKLAERIYSISVDLFRMQPDNIEALYGVATGATSLADTKSDVDPEFTAEYREKAQNLFAECIGRLDAKERSAAETRLLVYAHMSRAEILLNLDRNDEAYSEFEQTAKLAESAYPSLRQREMDRDVELIFNAAGRSHRFMADIDLKRNDLEAALEQYQFSLKWINDHLGDPSLRASIMEGGGAAYTLEIGRTLFKLGRRAEAETYISKWEKIESKMISRAAGDASALLWNAEKIGKATEYFRASGRIDRGMSLWNELAQTVAVSSENIQNDRQYSILRATIEKSKGDLLSRSPVQGETFVCNDRSPDGAASHYASALKIMEALKPLRSDIAFIDEVRSRLDACRRT